jgi:hypothetical protein
VPGVLERYSGVKVVPGRGGGGFQGERHPGGFCAVLCFGGLLG